MSGRVEAHDYHSCRDLDCPLPWCRIWKEALDEIAEAYQQGFAAGFAAAKAAEG